MDYKHPTPRQQLEHRADLIALLGMAPEDFTSAGSRYAATSGELRKWATERGLAVPPMPWLTPLEISVETRDHAAILWDEASRIGFVLTAAAPTSPDEIRRMLKNIADRARTKELPEELRDMARHLWDEIEGL